ncbi:MAG: helix-turn-helix transcriptional regulator [Lachnospiraceae bacterium]|nr:helix-turn-helix transcriptional regulator [Lachnospiraceae bacterium]
MTFGERLKNLMEEKDVTQKEVSQNLNIAISTFNGYANDYREPDFSTLASLAKYFGVTIDYLLGVTDERISYDDTEDQDQLNTLIHYYSNMNKTTRSLLLEEAKLLLKYDSQIN